jgi:Ca2+-binding RTX toxin-like protein
LTGNIDNDLLIAAENGGNTLIGGQGDDTIYGSLQNGNTMNGSSGNDLLVAGLGNDTLIGGIGNDILVGGYGNDILVGGDDIDEFQFLSCKENTLSVLVGTEQVLRSDGGFGGSDIISDFSLGDRISITELGRNAVVTVTNDSFGAAVITIAGTTSNGQSAAQTITVLGIAKEQLLAPGSQAFAIFENFITTANTNNVDGISTFTISG